MTSRTHRELDSSEINDIVGMVTSWRHRRPLKGDVRSTSASLSEIRRNGYNLNPSIYMEGLPGQSDRDAVLAEVEGLVARLEVQHSEADVKDSIASEVIRGLDL
jgi:type I restriction-modification system DNA methylase subunit